MKFNCSTIWLPYENRNILMWSILCLNVSGHNSTTLATPKLELWEMKIIPMLMIFPEYEQI